MRVVRSLLGFAALVVVLATLLASLGVYLAFTGRNLPLLRTLVAQMGKLIEGQRTEQVNLDVRLRPQLRELQATALLDVRSERDGRERLYFFLNDALRLERVWQEAAGGPQTPLPFYRLWLITVVDLPAPLQQDESMRLGFAYRGNPAAGGLSGHSTIFRPDDVAINVDSFWYPTDLASFFTADVRLTLPSDLVVVHNGNEAQRVQRGKSASLQWSASRPVAGMALVAGRYRESVLEVGQSRHRVFLQEGVNLDPGRIAANMADSNTLFNERFGASGFPQLTLFVNRSLDQAFNDGTGLIGIAPRYFREGDYGFAIVAHEVAHNWWGGTVAEKWLSPGTGGEWIVEGFAQLSSLLAVKQHLGEGALLRRLDTLAFDPSTTGVVAEMSAIDNTIDPNARPTIYNKGGYVAFMLHEAVGEDLFSAAARSLVDRFRYSQATDRDVEAIFSEVTQRDLSQFFARWVRSGEALDLSLDPREGGAVVRNHGTATVPAAIALWRFPPGMEPERQEVALENETPLGNVERLVLDPELRLADMFRGNNVLPRHSNPRGVAVSARNEIMIAYGEPHPWASATVKHYSRDGEVLHAWLLDHGLFRGPRWSGDGTRLIAIERDRTGAPRLVSLNVTDGSRTTVSADERATALPDGVIVARGNQLIKLQGDDSEILARWPGADLDSPLAAPDGKSVAYAAKRGSEMDLRLLEIASGADVLLLTWPASDVDWAWSPDGTGLFAVLPGDWDWQLWELPAAGGSPRALAREAAAVGDMAVASQGQRIAFIAAATLNYNREHREIFVLDRTSGNVQRLSLGGDDAHSVAWLSDDELLVVVSEHSAAMPRHRQVRRLYLADGSLASFP